MAKKKDSAFPTGLFICGMISFLIIIIWAIRDIVTFIVNGGWILFVAIPAIILLVVLTGAIGKH